MAKLIRIVQVDVSDLADPDARLMQLGRALSRYQSASKGRMTEFRLRLVKTPLGGMRNNSL